MVEQPEPPAQVVKALGGARVRGGDRKGVFHGEGRVEQEWIQHRMGDRIGVSLFHLILNPFPGLAALN